VQRATRQGGARAARPVELVRDTATRKDATPAQIALAWLLSRKPWIVPIPGTIKLHRLEENVGAASVSLTREDLCTIEDALSKITVHGARYSADRHKLVSR
jgi:aryl-alcohol dehydrogenase-like predicted oxidoreductase